MLKLFHHPFSSASRFVRLMLAEHEAKVEMVVERPWERRPDFLALNPAATVPVMVENDGPPIVGPATIMEYVDETRGYALSDRRLMPNHPEARAEMRRLVDWFGHKMQDEVTQYFAMEKLLKLEIPASLGGGAPDNQVLRVARLNVKHHLRYIGWLAGTRNWLAGDRLTFADLAAAAELSVIDYLGEVPWDEDAHAKAWYARVKSRPSFRGLLQDKMPGLPANRIYADLDF
ncbi:glutathione S-transferase family protein [Oharaeibacter diazotrophicus]|uniref:Glutathione S-transferase n=1 Tax=Oharaeibacter diazotrophicus TaxID=1920512 RepID=A0A4R6R6J9_9HYPH|nr:glutathione S-transferase family protein [Oharaeibacter diazotrophicus]TDP81462.1 glutathione S-transferase [Oharaeibacter diazotrophicus]BBE73700.1 stringent starvation protein A [Pleomorphomonas sp. SM30]GLS75489.1 glutathione S-transferase [Oharaeibacter diazotrophicus]